MKDPDNPNIRYVLCLNPKRQKVDSHTRMELIRATIVELDKIKNTRIKYSQEKMGARAGKIWAKYKTEKYFQWSVVNGKLNYHIVQEVIDKEKKLDGCYIIRSDVAVETFSSEEVYQEHIKN